MQRGPPRQPWEVRISYGGGRSKADVCSAAMSAVDGHRCGDFCGRHGLPAVLGFRQGLGASQREIEESVAKR